MIKALKLDEKGFSVPFDSPLSPQKYSSHIKDKDFTLVSNFQVEEDDLDNIEGHPEEVVSLTNAELKQNKLFGSSVTYTMVNTKNEKIERKFNDFVLLRKAFVHNFPG